MVNIFVVFVEVIENDVVVCCYCVIVGKIEKFLLMFMVEIICVVFNLIWIVFVLIVKMEIFVYMCKDLIYLLCMYMEVLDVYDKLIDFYLVDWLGMYMLNFIVC